MNNNEDPEVLALMTAPLSKQREILQQWGYGDLGLLILMSSCDGKCFFCAQPAVTNRTNKEVTSKKIIERWLDSYPPKRILIGGTEPMSHPLFFSIIAILNRCQCDIEVMTSGIRIQTTETIEKLARLGVRKIALPLYSVNSSVHDNIVGIKGHWDKVNRAIELAKEHHVEVLIHTLALKRNIHTLKELAFWVENNGLEPLVLAPLREKESLFRYEDEGVSFDVLQKELKGSNIRCTGFPLCFSPSFERGGATVIQLYFRGQKRTFSKEICKNCSKQHLCDGVTLTHLKAFQAKDLTPFAFDD